MLVGKVHRAKELNIQLTVDSETVIPDPCPHREIVITLLGNAIENSLEAISRNNMNTAQGKIEVSIRNEPDFLNISVQDTGPGIDPRLGGDIFKDGVTTKGDGRGFGLALLSRLVTNIGGTLSIVSSPSGATLKASLPLRGGIYDG